MEGDTLILLIKEVFAFHLVVFHPASSISAVNLNLSIQNPSGHVCGVERSSRAPFAECPIDYCRRLSVESNDVFDRVNIKR
jgi:hypothetical protein